MYDHTYNNTLARIRNIIGKDPVNNVLSFRNNIHFEGQKVPF